VSSSLPLLCVYVLSLLLLLCVCVSLLCATVAASLSSKLGGERCHLQRQ
jgi:hypothetical protein